MQSLQSFKDSSTNGGRTNNGGKVMKKHLIYLITAVSAFLICTSAYAKIDSVLPDEASVTVKGSYNESGIAVTAAIKPITGSGDENGGSSGDDEVIDNGDL